MAAVCCWGMGRNCGSSGMRSMLGLFLAVVSVYADSVLCPAVAKEGVTVVRVRELGVGAPLTI